MDLSALQKNYLLVPLTILLSFVIIFILNIVNKQKDENKVYHKAAISSAITSALIVYVHTLYPVLEEIIATPAPF